MRFWKMEGLGNDFVVVTGPRSCSTSQIAALCDRRRGIGADGLLVLSESGERIRMTYFNADGSPAEMCGNGLRCVARLATELGMVAGPQFIVETPVGPRRVQVSEAEVTAELGPAVVGEHRRIGDRLFQLVSVGNPHAVTWVSDLEHVPLESTAATLQEEFVDGVNVEMAVVDSPHRISMRVWERGVGETAACGTGAVAAASVGLAQGLTQNEVEIRLPGGMARVRLEDGTSWITGPARLVYRGEWMG
ncbi:MAG: diaminopimelate epimerase [Actinomycetia bacterium]|nr:diaminopimelate epimerase [Actinomycetes bacterium]